MERCAARSGRNGFLRLVNLELQLITITLERYAHQLASCSYPGFAKQLLQRSFDSSFGNLQAIRDLFIRKAFENERKNLPLAVSKLGMAWFGRIRPNLLERPAKQILLEEHFSIHRVANSLNQ